MRPCAALEWLEPVTASLISRALRRLRAVDTRLRYRLGRPTLRVGSAEISTTFRHPISVTAKPELLERYRAHFATALAPELSEAKRLLQHRFTLLGHTMRHGSEIAWSRDPVSGRDWSRAFSPEIPYRGEHRLGDIKLPWELNKHQYFFTLGKAAWLTGDERFAVEIVRQIDHWIGDNPCHCGIHWISALETGTRAVSWILTYPFFAELCTGRVRERLVRSIAEHMLFVEQNLSTIRFANTHLVGEAAALVLGGLFLDTPHSSRWVRRGLGHLEVEIERQVRNDGVHAEQSIAYHRFFLDHYYLVDAVLGANGHSFGSDTLAAMEKMTAFLLDVVFPDGSAPAFGDGDDARGIWCRADCPGDYRSLLALGALRFRRGDFKYVADGPAEELLWLHGKLGLDRFLALPSAPPAHTSSAYTDAGYYIMRTGWEASDPVLVFDCGPLGHGPAGHGHADALSIQLYSGGFPFLVDSGTYSYNLDYGLRNAFRSTAAHNTVVVDQSDQSIPEDRMSWRTAANAYCRRSVATRWFDLVDGVHDGYRRLPDPVTHRRVVVFLKPDVWVVYDELAATEGHTADWMWHMAPECDVASSLDGTFVLTAPNGARLTYVTRETPVGSADRCDRRSELVATDLSPRYGEKVTARAIRRSSTFVEGRLHAFTCFSSNVDARIDVVRQERGLLIEVTPRAADARLEPCAVKLFYLLDDERSSHDEHDFDGDLLYQDKRGAKTHAVWATGFRHLVLDDRLEVHCLGGIESLVLSGETCEVTYLPNAASGRSIKVAPGIEIRTTEKHPVR
jgi:uncharacterized heparinase superfamily protein